MSARGTDSKNTVFAKLQEVFPDAFWEEPGKILRVPLDENGSRVEIKVSLTAAKTNLGDGVATSAFSTTSESAASAFPTPTVSSSLEPTEEEKNNVQALIKSLGL